MSDPAVSVVVPTRDRAAYLDVALASLRDQRDAPPHELLVVDDRSTDETRAVAARHGVRVVPARAPGGLNAGRNTGIAATTAPVIAFVDDDVWAPPTWLAALHAGAERHPDAGALGGPIRARLLGPAPRSCGREPAPITTLDLGPGDRDAERIWGANLTVRRGAVEAVGEFDESLPIYGDEEEWQARLLASGGRIAYVADAWLEHRRMGPDSRLRALARAEYRRGRAARRDDRRKGSELPLGSELRNIAGAGWHTVRRRCPQGLIMGAHSTGRLVEALRGGR
ncbi:MAG: glycosyltransferase family 2 protein [Solirubrobacterales bacterium]|nr:glycosyltransferase family 2 protein [Solirubrobacterales bacterium]